MPRRLADLSRGLRTLAGIASGRRVLTGPRTVALIIADDCNSSCVMCWYHSPLLRGGRAGAHPGPEAASRPRFMDGALFESIVRQCRDLGTRRIVLGGTGEPALHPDLDAMLELVASLGLDAYVITNGLAVDGTRARRWAALPAHFRFSVHAGDAHTWLAVHPAGTREEFGAICSAIATLSASECAEVSLMHVIQRANFRGLVRMVEHAGALGVRELVILPVRAEGEVAAAVVLGAEEEAELDGVLVQARTRAETLGIRSTLDDYIRDRRHVRRGRLCTRGVYDRMSCVVGWSYAELDIDGTMRPCEGSRVVLGNAAETPIAEMWRSPRYAEFRRAARILPRRGTPVPGCSCDACCMVKFNRNVHEVMRLRSLRPSAP